MTQLWLNKGSIQENRLFYKDEKVGVGFPSWHALRKGPMGLNGKVAIYYLDINLIKTKCGSSLISNFLSPRM